MICRTEKKRTDLSSLPAVRRRKCLRKANRKSLKLQRLCLRKISAKTLKKVRIAVVAVLIAVGVLLIIGAIGNGDYYGYLTGADFVHIAVGLAMAGAGIAVQAYAESEGL